MPDFTASLLQEAIDQLRPLGIALTLAPGEYIVNFVKGEAIMAYRTRDLADALAHGLATGPANAALPPLGLMGKGNASQRAHM